MIPKRPSRSSTLLASLFLIFSFAAAGRAIWAQSHNSAELVAEDAGIPLLDLTETLTSDSGLEQVASASAIYVSAVNGSEALVVIEAEQLSPEAEPSPAQAVIEQAEPIEADDPGLKPVTDAVTITSQIGAENILASATLEADTQLAAIVKNGDSYEFLDITYSGGKVEANVPSGAPVQLFSAEKGKMLDTFVPSYINPDFVRYQALKQAGALEGYDGFIPDSIMLYGGSASAEEMAMFGGLGSDSFFSGLTQANGANVAYAYDKAYPEKFDQRNASYITSIKDQKTTSLCWAFSSIGAVETLLGKSMGTKLDLSVANTAYTLSNKSKDGYNRGLFDPGNFNMSAAYMSGGQGPVLESSDPLSGLYNGTVGQKAASVANIMAFETLVYQISAIKDRVQKYGTVVTAMYVEGNGQTSAFYNSKSSAYYMASASKIPNHIVQIIGWDNNYDANNFTTKPPMDGAWIVRNSWGEGFGDKGYNYISYADNTIAKTLNAVTKIEFPEPDETLYSHDPYGQVGSINYNSQTAWTANTFVSLYKNETLSAVSFYSSNVSVNYEIWLSETGNLSQKKKLQSGTTSSAGYTTVKLQTPVALPYQNFAVIVKMNANGAVVSLPIEKNLDKYLSAATSKPGQSFSSKDGVEWEDISSKIANANLCVRAWTKSAEAAKNNPLSAEVLSVKKAAAQPSPTPVQKPLEAQETLKAGGVTYAEAAQAIAVKFGIAGNAISALQALGCYDQIPGVSMQSQLSREDFCYQLAKVMKLSKTAGKSMSDISTSYAKSAIITLYSKKIVGPYSDGTFRPRDKILKTDMDKWLAKVPD